MDKNVPHGVSAEPVISAALRGSVLETSGVNPYLPHVFNSLNYIECHDNCTYYDHLKYECLEKDELLILQKHRFTTSLVLVSQGISFIHGGQEFYRSKQGVENSYKSSDNINWFDWEHRDLYIDYVNYVKELINIRKSYKGFRLNNNNLIEKHTNIDIHGERILEYTIDYDDKVYKVLINGSLKEKDFFVDKEYKLIANSARSQADHNGIITVNSLIEVDKFSLVILIRIT